MSKKEAIKKMLLLLKKYKIENLDDIEIDNIKLQQEDKQIYKDVIKILGRDYA